MPFTTFQGAFTSGELAPSLTARIDLAKYSQGCRTLRNFLVQPHGGATKRPGFLMLEKLPGAAALLPFTFNCNQAYVLVFGDKWLRIATAQGMLLNAEGGVLEIASPYTLEQAQGLSFAQSGDVLFLACSGVVPHKLKRLAHDKWEFEAMSFKAPLSPAQWVKTAVTSVSGYNLAYGGGELFRRDLNYGTYGEEYYSYSPVQQDLYAQASSSYMVTNIQFVNGARKSDGSVSYPQLTTPYHYVVTAINDKGKESEASVPAHITGPASNNWQAGDYVQLSWQAVPGAVEYCVYKGCFGGSAGYAATTSNLYWNDYNTAALSTQTPPKWTDPFPDNDYPAVVGFFEQRLVFASSPKRPQTIWLSRSGDYENFSASSPLQADDSIELTIAGNEVSRMNWLVALRSLILGAEGMEWELSSSEGPFTAKSARVTPQSYRGSASLPALVVGNTVLHITRSGREVRDLKYDFGSDSYGGTDRTILAAHLFEGRHIKQWCFQPAPHGIIWLVRDDGMLLGMTFQAEHDVCAWHRHDTDGRFHGVCSVPGGRNDRLFCVVERDENFYLEVLAESADGVYLDSALRYSGPATREIGGLEHLEGKEVGLAARRANGFMAAEAPRRVTNGRIQLDAPAEDVTVGLIYQADLETMPVELSGEGGVSLGRKKHINAVNIIFKDTITARAGGNFTRMEDLRWRSAEAYGQGLEPFSGSKRVVLGEGPQNSATLCIRSEGPLPMTVLALLPELEVK